MKLSIKLDRFYLGKQAENIDFKYDLSNKKRPSWIKFEDINEDVVFIKILINNEAFWYRRYFDNYFFPLNAASEDYKNYYNEIAEDYEKMVPQNTNIAKFIASKLIWFNIPKNAKIIEIGAGTGLISEKIAEKGYKDLTLMDISFRCLEIAKKKKVLQGCKFIEADILNFYPKDKFDVVYNSMSLDYFNETELKIILKLLKGMLKNRGIILSVDRHIYPQYNKTFSEIDSGGFSLKTNEGEWKYNYFIGKNE